MGLIYSLLTSKCIDLSLSINYCMYFKDIIQYYYKFVNLLSCLLNPFAPGDFAEKRVLKLVEWFSGHCPAIKS